MSRYQNHEQQKTVFSETYSLLMNIQVHINYKVQRTNASHVIFAYFRRRSNKPKLDIREVPALLR